MALPEATTEPAVKQVEEAIDVLLVEDSASDARLIEEALRRAQRGGPAGEAGPAAAIRLMRVSRMSEALEALDRQRVDAVLLDLSLPDSRGLKTFQTLNGHAPRVPVVVLSGLADEEMAARAVREGAQDYLVKGQPDGQVLVRSLRYAIERRRAEIEREARWRAQLARAEAEAAQRRLGLLAAASRAFAAAGLNFHEAAGSVARSVAEVIGDGCAVLLLSANRRMLEPVALHHAQPEAAALAKQLLAAAPVRVGQGLVGRVAETGEPLLAQELPVAALRQTPAAEYRPYLDRFTIHSVAAVPMRVHRRVQGVLAIWRDVSAAPYVVDDERFLQDLADRAALALENARLYGEVQQALRTRDAFLNSVAHDLKSPLAVVKGQAQLLARQVGRMVSRVEAVEDASALRPALDTVPERLWQIGETVDRMTGMLDELLDLTRLQMGEPLSLRREPVDLVALARRLAEAHQQRTETHEIQVVVGEDGAGEGDGEGVTGEWDQVRLERVLDNLLSNALKYSPDGGEVTVTVQRVVGPEARAVLSVQDRGLGIPAADLPHIFDRFHRAENVVGRIRGTGVGLASVRQIVEQHGGTIAVSSEEGKGSRFTVSLPLEPAAGM